MTSVPHSQQERGHPEKKINKETFKLNYIIDQMNVIVTHRTFHPNTKGFTVFSALHGTFFKNKSYIRIKANLHKHRKIEITLNSDHSRLKVDKTKGATANTSSWRQNGTLQNGEY